MAPGSRGIGAVFVHSSAVFVRSPEFLSNAPGLFARIFDLAPDVGFRRSWYRRKACAAYFLQGSGFAGIRAWTCEIWSPRTEATGVFLVRLRAVFRSGFRLDPVNSWRSESSTSCMDVSSFQRARARGSTCCESGRLCAQAWQRRWENSGRNFSTTLFRRPVFTRVVDVAPDVGFRRSWYRRKACATYFSNVLAITPSFLVRFRPVKYGIEALDILYTLVKGCCKSGGSTVWNLSPNKLRSDLTWGLPKLQIGWFNGLESQSKQVEGCKSGGSTVWNLSPNKLRSDLTWGLPKLQIGWFNGLESQSKQVEGCKSGGSTVWNLSPNRLRGDLTWGLPKLQIGWFNGLESQSKQVEDCKSGGSTVWNLSPNKLRSDLTWGLPKLQIGCLTDVVVAEIVAGPHALDSCECMNIEGAMQAPLRWLLLCLLGRSALAFHTLGLTISADNMLLVISSSGRGSPLLISGLSSNFSVRGKIAPVWYNKINETFLALAIQNSLFPGFDTITDLGDSARGVHSPG
uniref:Uncharacterized protein n=1 Tax=Fagus sylvatica TaxID=28930 RepID=A0A2N9IE56_FAGSY